jgi:hypothetical protein
MKFDQICMAAVVAVGLVGAPAFAQNQDQGGLVNVATGDIGIDALNNTTVQVPIGIAAQVCGVDANVIAEQKEEALTDCKVDQSTASESFINFVSKKKG